MPTVHVDGVRLHHDVVGAGPPLLLLGGLGTSSGIWGRTVEVLAPRFTVITLDNRGSGRSDTPPGRLWSTSDLARDAVGLLDMLGIEAAHVYGLSMGGMVAQELAIARPERVRSLVLGCSSPGGREAVAAPPALLARLAAHGVGPLSGDLDAFLRLMLSDEFLTRHARDIEPRRRELAAMLAGPAGWRRQLPAAVRHDASARLHLICAPTLVLHGADDRLVPVANARILAARIPRAELVELAGAGHAYEVERPAATYGALLDFLARHRDVPPGVSTGRRTAHRPVVGALRLGTTAGLHAGRVAAGVTGDLAGGVAPAGRRAGRPLVSAVRLGGSVGAHAGRLTVAVPVELARTPSRLVGAPARLAGAIPVPRRLARLARRRLGG